MKISRVFSIATSAVALFLLGCGRESSPTATDQKGGATAGSQGAVAGAAGAPAPASGRQIEITGNDAMKFSVTEIRAKPGEALSVTLNNIGTMPKFSMGHNWVLLKRGVNADEFVNEAAQAATTDYVPANRKNDMIAYTRLLGPKEKDTVAFHAPTEPGRYIFLCSFPGHYQVGMKGELIVE